MKIACVWLLTIVFAVGGTSSGQPAQDGDKTLITYKGLSYSCIDLTLVSYADGLAHVAAAREMYDKNTHTPPPYNAVVLPGQGAWRPKHDDDLGDYYHHQLDGVIEVLLRRQVLDEFRRRYPLSSTAAEKRVDRGAFAQYVELYASSVTAATNLSLDVLKQHPDEATFVKEVRTPLHLNPAPDAAASDFKEQTARFPYSLMNATCFPLKRGAKIAPWFQEACEASLQLVFVQTEIERDLAKYKELLEAKFGEYHAFVISNAQEKDKDQLLAIVSTISNDAGEVAAEGMQRVNDTLAELGSPTRIKVIFGTWQGIAEMKGIALSGLKIKTFMKIPTPEITPLADYLYVFQTKPTPHFTRYDSAPGNFLYDVGHDTLLRPICEEVLRNANTTEKFTLPSVDQLVANARFNVLIASNLYGVTMPKVIHDAR